MAFLAQTLPVFISQRTVMTEQQANHSDSAEIKEAEKTDSAILNKIQVILSEKRTALSVMRTGIAILVLPLSVMSLLIATSKSYEALTVLHLLIPLGILNLALVVLSVYLIIHSIIRIRFYDRLLYKLKQKNSTFSEFIP